MRANSGFFDHDLLDFLEERHLHDIVVARMTCLIKKELKHLEAWRELDCDCAATEFTRKLQRTSSARSS